MAVRAHEQTPVKVCYFYSFNLILSNIENMSFGFFVVVAGDGGNDVSMIQAADCGIGIEGKVRGLTKLRKQSVKRPSVIRAYKISPVR